MKGKYSNTRLNINYALMQGTASALFAGLSSNGTIYLMGQGIDSQWVGIIFAAANLLSVFVQPLIARLVDQSHTWTVKHYIFAIIGPVLAILLAINLLRPALWLLAILFVIAYASVSILTPLISSIAFLFNSAGYHINYGVCRSMGSLLFGIVSTLIGQLLLQFDESVIIWVTIGIYLLLAFALWLMPVDHVAPITHLDLDDTSFVDELEEDQALLRKYPHLLYVMLGSLLFFMFHNIANTYFYQIVANVGGSEDEMGLALTIGAWIEIPMMLAYATISKKMSHRRLLLISGCAFTAKALFFVIANNMVGIYFAMSLQLLSFALYIIASVHYMTDRVPQKYRTTGLALLTTGQTLGAVIGNLSGGFFIEVFSVEAVLWLCFVISVLGAILYYYGLYVKDPIA